MTIFDYPLPMMKISVTTSLRNGRKNADRLADAIRWVDPDDRDNLGDLFG